MSELAKLQTDLLASMVGVIVLGVTIAGIISAGYWLLVTIGKRRRREHREMYKSEEWFDELNVHLEIGDCRPDCGCDKPCGRCE
jgi:hypothetical protein